MPATVPVTVDAFVDLVRRSGLIDPSRLEGYCAQLEGGLPDRPYRLARRMVQDGLLTTFQAAQLLKGKHKGYTLGNYTILERIGRGGMGTVYLAEHRIMRHRVAIKVLPPEQAENPTIRERFYREARSAAHLSHPNLVRAHDIDQDGALHYLVMEYVDGVNLQELVTRGGSLAIARAANYIAQAATGLEYAHETAGLVHRDIKPSNLLVDRGGTVKVLDMGLARLGQVAFFEGDADQITRKYQDNSILGTADYIAPEQALNSQQADVRADLYSLGCTFYFLLTGQPPFPTGTVTQKLMWHQMSQPKPVVELRTDCPAGIAALVARMMAKDASERTQHPGEVVATLAPWLNIEVPPPADEEIPRLCAAAQGPSSNTASISSVSLGTRLARSASLSSVSLSGRSSPSANGETPVGVSQTDLSGVPFSDSSPRSGAPAPPPVAVRISMKKWLTIAAALVLGAIGGAAACMSVFAR